MENCDTMWSINKNFQTITMKMCVETVMPVLLEYNLTNLTIPSLHNATFNSTKNESFTGNILNQTNSTVPNLNTNSSEAKVNLTSPSSRIILPSPSPETWILTSIVPSSSEPVETPSPINGPSNYIRGSGVSPSSFMMNYTEDDIYNTKQQSIDEISTPLSIVLLICSIILALVLLWCLYKRRTKSSKIHSCHRYKKPVTKKPNNNRPTDYILEQLTPASTPRTQPHPPKEERKDPDIDDKIASG